MRAGDDVTENDIEQWLDIDEGDPGYQILSQEEIAEDVLQADQEVGYPKTNSRAFTKLIVQIAVKCRPYIGKT